MGKLLNNPVVFSLLLITFFSMLAYLPLIPFLGFYSDDFFFGYVSHFYGIQGIVQSLAVDRPFNGYLLVLLYSILGLGDNVLFWHISMFLVRLLGGFALFFALRKIWPNRLSAITSITLLFLIYPGFLQQVLPLGFGGWMINLTLWIISFLFTVFAVKNRGKFKLFFFTLIAIFLQINSFLQLEFFIGMEFFRLLIITYIIKNEIRVKTIKKTFIYWSPYILTLIIFVLWRIFIFKSTREATDINWVLQTYYSNPIWILKIPLEVFLSFLNTLVFAYFVPIIINLIRVPLQNSIIALSLGIFSSVLLYFYYKRLQEVKSDTKNFGKQLLLIGLSSIFVALIPIIISGRFVQIFNVYDRYTITSIISISFVIVGFLLFKISNATKNYILIALVALSITSHLMNGYWHKIMWDKQKDLWWQLYWRAPNIEKNAMLVLNFPPFSEDIPFKDIINKVRWYRFYWVDYQIWAPGNLFFNYNNPPQNHFTGDFLEDKGIIDKIRNQVIENITDRNITYIKDFRNTVIISTPSDTSCLWVLDKQRNELPLNADDLLKASIDYSDAGKLVQVGPSVTPPKEIFGSEPSHGWCYYFQKASLARQFGDWDKLSKLKEEVIQKNLKPKDPNEWIPFQGNLR